MLRMHLSGADEKRMAKTYTANPEAYQDYLKGRYLWNKRTEEGFNEGIEYFQRAIEKDPTHALAYDGLADSYTQLPSRSFVRPKEAYPKAKEAALKALEIDDTLAEAHTSLGFIKALYDWDGRAGRRNSSGRFSLIRAMRWLTDGMAKLYGQWDGLTKASRRTNEPWNLTHSRSPIMSVWEKHSLRHVSMTRR
jgi:tetratricopeptide (TPR) repeat protein